MIWLLYNYIIIKLITMKFDIILDETDGQITFVLSDNSGYRNELSIGTGLFRKQLFLDGTFDNFIEALELRKNHTLKVADCNRESIKNIFKIVDSKFKIYTGVYTDFTGVCGNESSLHGVHHFDQRMEIPLNIDDNANKLLNVFAILKMLQPQLDENEQEEINNSDDSSIDNDSEDFVDDFE